nr:alpha/beta hydrolase [uncultured Dyadobacter sp.]
MKRILIMPLFLLCYTAPAHPSFEKDKPRENAIAPSVPSKSGYSNVNGIKMYYEIYGEGAPLVLIHGGGSTIETTFGRIIPMLARRRQLICVELQAHGRTTDRAKPLSFEQDADDVATLLGNLGIPKADFFGFSNGGNTALEIAIRHPEICNRIVAGSFLLKRNGTFPQFWESMKNPDFAQMPQQYKAAFLKVTPDTAKLMNLFQKCAGRMSNFRDMTDQEIQSIKAPVLLVNGDADVASSEHVVSISKLIPSSHIAIMPGGHGAYIGEIMALQSDDSLYRSFVPILEKFLDGKP